MYLETLSNVNRPFRFYYHAKLNKNLSFIQLCLEEDKKAQAHWKLTLTKPYQKETWQLVLKNEKKLNVLIFLGNENYNLPDKKLLNVF